MLKPCILRLLFCLLCVGILGSNFWTMRNWTERTGFYDDMCYLRQAHLFQRFGCVEAIVLNPPNDVCLGCAPWKGGAFQLGASPTRQPLQAANSKRYAAEVLFRRIPRDIDEHAPGHCPVVRWHRGLLTITA